MVARRAPPEHVPREGRRDSAVVQQTTASCRYRGPARGWQNMRNLLKMLGIIIVGIFVVAGIGIAYLAHLGAGVDRDAQAYVDAAVPAIVADWSVAEMRRQASPDLLKNVKPDDLQNLFALFAKLGPLVAYQGSKASGWTVGTSIGSGKTVTVHCVAHATFAHGAATIDVVVLKQSDVWKIYRFNVNSPAMIENAVGRAI
jgi:hypothetical protein